MAKAFINDIYPFFENDLTYQNLKNSRTKEDAMTSHISYLGMDIRKIKESC